MPADARRFAPATQRNRQPILEVLLRTLPPQGTVLEVSSGTGEHATFLAPRLAPRQWLPSDIDPAALDSIRAWQDANPADNLHQPIRLNAQASIWPVDRGDCPPTLNLQEYPITAVVNINMVHIAPWAACQGLMAGAGRILPAGGVLYLYGPFKRGGKHTAPSNEAFDLSLRAQNPEWGVRDLEAVTKAAQHQGLALVEVVDMPANNLSVLFKKDTYKHPAA
jgi:hypothetical protein